MASIGLSVSRIRVRRTARHGLRLNDLSPHALTILAASFLGFIYLLSPFYYQFASAEAVVLLAAGFFAFILSSAIASQIFHPGSVKLGLLGLPNFDSRIRFVISMCLLFSFLGVMMRIVDYFLVRKFDLSEGVIVFRLGLQSLTYKSYSAEAAAGLLSAVGAFFYGFTYPLGIVLVYWWKKFSKLKLILGIPLVGYSAIESFMSGGVWGAASLYLFICFAVLHRVGLEARSRRLVRGSLLLPVVLAGVVVVILGGMLFIARVEYMVGSIDTYLRLISTQNFVRPAPWLYSIVDFPIFGKIAFIFFWLANYLLQGAAEFSYLVVHFNAQTYLYGAKQFFVINKFLSIIGLTNFSAYDLTIMNPRPGRYQTFLGDAYMDFGAAGLLIEMLYLGVIAAWLHMKRSQLRISGLFLYPFVQSNIISGFLVNSFSGSKLYYLVALVMTVIVYLSLKAPRRANSFGR